MIWGWKAVVSLGTWHVEQVQSKNGVLLSTKQKWTILREAPMKGSHCTQCALPPSTQLRCSVHTGVTADDSCSTAKTENCSTTKNRSRLCTYRLMAVAIQKPLNLPYYFWRFLYPLCNTPKAHQPQHLAVKTKEMRNYRQNSIFRLDIREG